MHNEPNKWQKIEQLPSRYEYFVITIETPLSKHSAYKFIRHDLRNEYEQTWKTVLQTKDTRFVSIMATVLLGAETSALLALGAPVPLQVGGCVLTGISGFVALWCHKLFKQSQDKLCTTENNCKQEMHKYYAQ